MKVLVPVKRVIDAYVRIRVKSDGSGVETQNVKMAMNPFCEIAMEQAIRMKESSNATEVIAVTIGSVNVIDVLRTALAMGADRAIHVVHESESELQPLAIAKILKKIVDEESPSVVLMGKQAIDNDHNQTGQMLSALLGWPQATFISKLNYINNKIQAVREIDGGLQTLQLKLPSILTVDLRLNDPRYLKLPDIMKAKRKPLETQHSSSFGIDLEPRYKTLSVEEPKGREAGLILNSVDELVEKLKDSGVIV